MHIKCKEWINFVIKNPRVHPNACTIDEIANVFHEVRNIKQIRGWKELHTSFRMLKMIKFSFNALLKILKKFEADCEVSLNTSLGNCLVMRRGRKDSWACKIPRNE